MLYVFWGKVMRGKNRGKYFGFPTVNLRLHEDIPHGVYVSETRLGRRWHKSISFIGAAKTFGEKKIHAESYIFNFDQDIYDKWVSIRLLKKIRENKRFTSQQDLIKAMIRDKKEALDYFRKDLHTG